MYEIFIPKPLAIKSNVNSPHIRCQRTVEQFLKTGALVNSIRSALDCQDWLELKD